jgi:EAL domain-containing protein (putative c-di-GMP-specific phosphodiesterase class I)
VRWHHPRHGLIPPDRFIPLAEATGAIRDIGRWVLGEACRQAASWRLDHGELDELGMSVNISGRQLQHGDLAAEVAEALEASGLPPHCLVLEITETVLMEDSASSRSMLARIKELGVQLAIDDFGTGYSSLSYLQQFPVDVLKIDRSFIRDLVGGGDSELVRTILDLARSLQLRTVAEGIESTAQLEALLELGCEYGQGFLMAAPAPAAEVELLLRRVQQSRIP